MLNFPYFALLVVFALFSCRQREEVNNRTIPPAVLQQMQYASAQNFTSQLKTGDAIYKLPKNLTISDERRQRLEKRFLALQVRPQIIAQTLKLEKEKGRVNTKVAPAKAAEGGSLVKIEEEGALTVAMAGTPKAPLAGAAGSGQTLRPPEWTFQSRNILFDSTSYVDNLSVFITSFFAPVDRDLGAIQILFDYISVERDYDYVELWDAFGLCDRITGSTFSDFYSRTCEGNYVEVWFYSDGTVSGQNGYSGFGIKGFRYGDRVPNISPVAVALADRYTSDVTTAVQFFGNSSYDADDALNTLSFRWSFGDGRTSTVMNPTHLYSEPGTYQVSLVVTDPYNDSSTDSFPVVINEIPPIPDFTTNAGPNGEIARGAIFKVFPVTNNRADIMVVDWGDGSQQRLDPYTRPSNGISHEYAQPGQYIVTVTVTNEIATAAQFSLITMLEQGVAPTLTVTDTNTRPDYTARYSFRMQEDGYLKSFNHLWGSSFAGNTVQYDKTKLDTLVSNGAYAFSLSHAYRNAEGKYIAGAYETSSSATDNIDLVTNIEKVFVTPNKLPRIDARLRPRGVCRNRKCTVSVRLPAGKTFEQLIADDDGNIIETFLEIRGSNKQQVITDCPRYDAAVAAIFTCKFEEAGTFYAVLGAVDNLGQEAIRDRRLNSRAGRNRKPVIKPFQGKCDRDGKCNFNINPNFGAANAITDLDGEIQDWYWQVLKFEDDQPLAACPAAHETQTFACQINESGRYKVQIVAVDDEGEIQIRQKVYRVAL